ncbi:MAG: neutral zinc metallopeptidase, partial [Mycobacterium sp.]
MRIRVATVAAVVLLVAGCGGGLKSESPSRGQETKGGAPDISNVKIDGDASAPVNKIAIEAIADLEQYWGEQFPKLYDKEFEQISGGYYAVTADSAAPPCTTSPEEVAGNAFYCSTEDVVAWDAQQLLPELQDKFGPFTIAVVMAHEWAHAVQARSNFTGRTVTKELQADCFAGAWS